MEIHVRLATYIADLLDNKFSILGYRFGIDPLLGLLPGLGDAIALILSIYIVWIGKRLGVPKDVVSKMVTNVVFDFVLGLIPLVGDISDFVYKANSKNLLLIKKHRETILQGEIVS